MDIRINLEAVIREQRIDERHSCFVVDDFFENPDDLVRHAVANQASFEMPHRSYPGLVLDLDAASFQEVHRFIRFRMNDLFDYARSGLKTFAQLSLTTLQPEAFTWIQRLPHTDPRPEPGRNNYALLVYLFRDEALGGTGFYRWRDPKFWQSMAREQRDEPEGGLTIVRTRYPMFNDPPEYITESNEAAELLTMVPARFNRMICYSGEVPHSAWIEDATRLTGDCASGRLTFNAFASVIPNR